MSSTKVVVVTSNPDLYWEISPVLQQVGISGEVVPDGATALLQSQRQPTLALTIDCAGQREIDLLKQARGLRLPAPLIAIAARPTDGFLLRSFADIVWQRPLAPNVVAETLLGLRGAIQGDKRVHERSELSKTSFLRYSYDGTRFHQAVLVDVSEGGACIDSLEPLQMARAMQIEFDLPAFRSRVTAVAQATWRNALGQYGLRFLQISEVSRELLKRWVAANNRPFASTVGVMPGTMR